jgi:hypothetical protein
MNFPLEYPLFRLFYWLVDTAGLGGIAAALVGGGSILMYALALYWVTRGSQANEKETYAYPTPAWHHHDEE